MCLSFESIAKGMDLSYFNGNVNFKAAKNAGIAFAILRSSYRTTTDEKFFEYVNGCKEAGIDVLGIYHFIYGLNEAEVKKEAKLAVTNAKRAGLSKGTFVFADFEYDTITKAANKGVTLGKKECISFTRVFCETVESLGYKPGVYMNNDYYKNMYDKTIIGKYPIWLADYTGEPDHECLFQQYTDSGNVPGLPGNVDLDYLFQNGGNTVKGLYSRNAVVQLANSWVGKNEANGSYKEIIDIYNSYGGTFPRGVKMQYDWAWCAATWSALAIMLGYTNIMPIEISCYYIIEEAKKLGCWVEDDGYVPNPGDGILYDWDDNGIGDNQGVPDHIGVVVQVNEKAGQMTVVEGNYSEAVGRRVLDINGRYIRGFITPKYDDNTVVVETIASKPSMDAKKSLDVLAKEVIAGMWGNGQARKEALTASGYNWAKVQAKVNDLLNNNMPKNEPGKTLAKVIADAAAQSFDHTLAGSYVTTADLYCRNGAGTNKRALVLIPKGTKVKNYGYYTAFGGVRWLYIDFTLNGVQYIGFSSGVYLTR